MPESVEVLIPLEAGEQLQARIVHPAAEPSTGVLVVHDASGAIPFYEDVAARVAAAGHVALLPDLYLREGPLPDDSQQAEMDRLAKLDKRRSIGDLLAATAWLQAQPEVQGDRVGVIGFSLGSTLALDLTAERADLAVAAFYPFPAGEIAPDEHSMAAPISIASEMRGPIIAFWGDHDEVVPIEDVHRLVTELGAHDVPLTYSIYEGVGHSFVRMSELELGRPTSAAALDAWGRAMTFFKKELPGKER